MVHTPYIAAIAALASGGLVAAAPVPPSLPDVQVRHVRLTDALSELWSQQLAANFTLVDDTLTANASMVGGQETLVTDLASLFPAGQQTLAAAAYQHFFDAINLMTGAEQGSFFGLDGARLLQDAAGDTSHYSPAALNESLLLPTFDPATAQIGGLQGAVTQDLVFSSEILALLTGQQLVNISTQIAQLMSDMILFDKSLVAAETAFNTALVSHEVATEMAAFGGGPGSDSVLNGAIDRGFNALNMAYDAQEQSLNNLLGITSAANYDPVTLTQSLLTGSAAQTFNDGSIGGLTGMSDQALAQLSDLFGLTPAQLTFATTNFDAAGLFSGLQALFSDPTLIAGPYGDVFSTGLPTIFTDISNVWGAIFGFPL